MKTTRFFSLLFAIALQAMPMCRVVTSQFLPAASSGAAIVLRWVVGGVALLGAFHAVSGASTVITSPLSARGTNGVAFAYRITTGPQAANQFNATPLPPGLTVSTTTGRITGTPTAVGSWTVQLTASDNGSASRTLHTNLALTIIAGTASPPTITTQPQSQTVNVGANVTFTVGAGGATPLSYQWRLGGVNISGQTASALALSAVTTAQAGSYSVVVANSAGAITSAPAVLTVNPLIAPTITTQPLSQTVNAGANVSMFVVASGTAPMSYQWRLGGVNLSGATAATLQLNSVNISQAGNYTVLVSNAAGTATSSTAVLTVNALVAPSIVTPPTSQTVLAGANVTFSVTASGTAPLSYQWRSGGVNLPGKTTSALQLNNVTTAQSGSYDVVVSNSVGSAISASAVLTVYQLPAFTTQPQSLMVLLGANATFSVVASGVPAVSYQWRFGGADLAGQTGSTLQLNGVTSSQAGTYAVVITNLVGALTSAPAILTVNLAAVPPGIVTQPQSQTVYAGANVGFSVVASGTAPLSYQWRLGGTRLAGQTTANLQLNGVTAGQAGNYTVVVTNSAGSITSAPATLTVNAPIAPTITSQPQSQTVNAGANVTFSVAASGTAPLSYQWRLGGTPLAGQTSSSLQLSSVAPSQAGSYSVVVSNAAGTATSSTAVLTVNSAPTITTQPLSQTATVGSTVNFSVTAAGTAPLRYQWRFGSSDLASATSSTLSLPAVTLGQSGGYVVVVSNPAGSVTSVVAVLTVNLPVPVPPTITTQPHGLTVAAGSNATFMVVAAGTAPLAYQWWLGTTNLADQTNAILSVTNVTSRQAGDYTVVVSNPVGSLTSAVATLTVTFIRPGTDPKAPWNAFAGRYNGLLSDTAGVAQGSSGFFSFNLSPRGTFSASVQLSGGWKLSTSGTLATDGTAISIMKRPGATPISVNWAVDLSGSDQITGTVSPQSEAWTAQLLGDRAVFNARNNPCPYAGKYTLDLPGSADDTNSPAGDSYGALTVDQNGAITLRGFLSDKTPAAQKTRLSRNGDWPLFVPLYSKTGALLAWVHFEDRAGDDFHGLASWIKPALQTSKYFAAGFNLATEIVGSRFNAGMATTGMLHLTNGIAVLAGGNLPQTSTNAIHVVSVTEIVGADPDQLKATFKPATGLFKGTFLSPGAASMVPFSGALMQKANYAAGCFLGTDQSGLVLLQNAPGTP